MGNQDIEKKHTHTHALYHKISAIISVPGICFGACFLVVVWDALYLGMLSEENPII